MRRNRPPYSIHVYKVLALLLGQVRARKDAEFQEYTVGTKALYRLLGLKHAPTRDEAGALITELKSFATISFGPEVDRAVTWMGVAEHEHITGAFKLKLSDELKPYILGLRAQFVTQYIQSVLRLRSRYSVLLYGLARGFLGYYEKEQHLVLLDQLIGALHLPLNHPAAREWRFLDRDILRLAQAEIHERTELRFQYRPIRARPCAKRGPVLSVAFFDVHEERWTVMETSDAAKGLAPVSDLPDREPLSAIRPSRKLTQARVELLVASGFRSQQPISQYVEHPDPHADWPEGDNDDE